MFFPSCSKFPQSSNQVYVLNSATGSWTRGADYPKSVFGASSLPYEDSFLVIGGVSQVAPQPTEIYRYDATDGSWVDTGLRMAGPRKFPVAIIADQEDICG